MKNVFYQVDLCTTYRTADAWQMITAGAKHWQLHLFDECYSKFDWTVEPVESFDSLVTRRISNLRKKYKKIRLWYSAGRDSHAILREFINRQVPIDELIYVDWQFVDAVQNDRQVVVDTVSRIYKSSNQPIPVVRCFTPSVNDYLLYWKTVSAGKNSGGVGSNFGLNVNSFSAILDSFGEFQDQDICNLFGLEKPKLKVSGSQVFFQMADSSVQHVMSPMHHIEWFFLNDTVPELTIKQCHMLLKYARVLAKIKFNNNLEKAILNLQHNQSYYNEYCIALGLGQSISIMTGSGTNKSYGMNSPLQASLRQVASNDIWDAQKLYKKFTFDVTDITANKYHDQHAKNQFVGIISKERKVANVL